jgi:hypothetical protein
VKELMTMDENQNPETDEVDRLDDVDAAAGAERLFNEFLANAFALPADFEALREEFDDDPDEPDPGEAEPQGDLPAPGDERPPGISSPRLPLRPMNLNLLTSLEASIYWVDLDAWVTWLRREYGLGATVVPPLWHRHPELRWELSALHTAWLSSYDPEASASAPITWHRELAEARVRLAEWVSRSGTGLTEDRPTQVTLWPGEAGYGSQESWDSERTRPRPVADRSADFRAWVEQDIVSRRQVEDQVRAHLRRSIDAGARLSSTGQRRS